MSLVHNSIHDYNCNSNIPGQRRSTQDFHELLTCSGTAGANDRWEKASGNKSVSRRNMPWTPTLIATIGLAVVPGNGALPDAFS